MPAGGAGRGRRDNGLTAAEYAVAGDVDPRVGEHLLDVLGAGGIAAYLQPTSDLHPVTRINILPARPVDRLFVDRQHLATAKEYVAKLTRDEGLDDLDAAWQRIVADFHTGPTGPERPWPAAEELDEDDDPRPASAPPAPDGPAGRSPGYTGSGPAVGATGPEPEGPRPVDELRPVTGGPGGYTRHLRRAEDDSLLDALDRFGADLPDDPDDDGYVPPAPPPLPRLSQPTVFAVLGIVAGLLLLLWPTVLPISDGTAVLLGFTGVLAGVITLIWRMRSGDDDEDDFDDGARV